MNNSKFQIGDKVIYTDSSDYRSPHYVTITAIKEEANGISYSHDHTPKCFNVKRKYMTKEEWRLARIKSLTNEIIKVDGKNAENKDRYNIEWNLKLEVEKKDHDVRILNSELFPSKMICGSLQNNLVIELVNMGDKSEDEVVIEIKDNDLNINERFSDIQLDTDYDSNAKYEKTIEISVDEELAKKGTYPLTINVYFNNDKLDDQIIVNLEIEGCEKEETPVQEVNETIEKPVQEINETVEEDESDNEENDSNLPNKIPIIRMGKQGITESSYFLPIVGILTIIGLIVIIVLVILIQKK